MGLVRITHILTVRARPVSVVLGVVAHYTLCRGPEWSRWLLEYCGTDKWARVVLVVLFYC